MVIKIFTVYNSNCFFLHDEQLIDISFCTYTGYYRTIHEVSMHSGKIK
jgi:hypothetical protein